MPLDTGQYLARHGWRGAGAPLDGENGRGLKRPLLIPQKRSLGGVGKDRDRAVEWWDDVFAAGAKSLSISIPGKTAPKASDSIPQAGEKQPRASLATLSKREHARRRLMSGFVRGEVLGPTHKSDEGPADDGSPPMTPAESKEARREAKAARRQAKAERRAAKAQRRERKMAKAARREERAARDAKRAERAALDAEREARRREKAARKQAKAERRAARALRDRSQEHVEPAQAAPRKRRSTAEDPPNKKRA